MGGERILIADDEAWVREIFIRALGERGYEVHGAVDGVDAYEKIRSGGYDLIVLDLKMPQMDGMELLRKIRETDEDVIVFCLTAYPSDESLRESLAEGCFDYITKPFDMDEVAELLARALDTRAVRRRDRGKDPVRAGGDVPRGT
ncbi:MAG: response regulator [bacterium]|nr:response regulator [bacterium]